MEGDVKVDADGARRALTRVRDVHATSPWTLDKERCWEAELEANVNATIAQIQHADERGVTEG
jgi:hypothetical protein